MNEDLVSIVMPAYNAERYIRDAVESVLQQTYGEWELLLVDDCSTDSTPNVISEYAERDGRIRAMRTSCNTGIPSEVRNVAMRAAQGRYIAFLDADDIWVPTKLEEQVSLMKRRNCAIVYSDYEKMDEDGTRFKRVVRNPSKTTYRELLGGNVILQSSGIFDVMKIGRPEFLQIHHEDFKFWLDALRIASEAVNTEKVHVYYRQQPNSLSGNKLRAMKWTWDVYRKGEGLSVFVAAACFVRYIAYAGRKFLK